MVSQTINILQFAKKNEITLQKMVSYTTIILQFAKKKMILEKMVSQTTNILHLQEKRKETRKSGFSDNKYFTFAPNKTTIVMTIKLSDLEFVKKFTRPNFPVKEFYTLKIVNRDYFRQQ